MDGDQESTVQQQDAAGAAASEAAAAASQQPEAQSNGAAEAAASGAEGAGQGGGDAARSLLASGDQGAAKDAASGQDGGKDAPGPEDAPLAAWDAAELGLGEGAKVDPALLDAFGKDVAVAAGLSLKQTRAIVEWQLGALEKARLDLRAKSGAELRDQWGEAAPARLADCLNLARQIDEGNPGFIDAIEKSGLADSAAFLRGLHSIVEKLAEDKAGAGAGAGARRGGQTRLEGIVEALAREQRPQP